MVGLGLLDVLNRRGDALRQIPRIRERVESLLLQLAPMGLLTGNRFSGLAGLLLRLLESLFGGLDRSLLR